MYLRIRTVWEISSLYTVEKLPDSRVGEILVDGWRGVLEIVEGRLVSDAIRRFAYIWQSYVIRMNGSRDEE
jgi:hypothetical protein